MFQDRLAEIAARFDLNSMYVFGSRATETASAMAEDAPLAPDNCSDVDIAVQPKRERFLSALERVELTEMLQDLLGVRRVDLVLLPEANSFLAADAVRGTLLCCADADVQAEEELYYLRKAADLAPIQRRMWAELMEERNE